MGPKPSRPLGTEKQKKKRNKPTPAPKAGGIRSSSGCKKAKSSMAQPSRCKMPKRIRWAGIRKAVMADSPAASKRHRAPRRRLLRENRQAQPEISTKTPAKKVRMIPNHPAERKFPAATRAEKPRRMRRDAAPSAEWKVLWPHLKTIRAAGCSNRHPSFLRSKPECSPMPQVPCGKREESGAF